MEIELLRYGVIDDDGDRFTPGCFACDGNVVPVLASLDPSRPLGLAVLREVLGGVAAEIPDVVIRGMIPFLFSCVEPWANSSFEFSIKRSVSGEVRDIEAAEIIAVGLSSPSPFHRGAHIGARRADMRHWRKPGLIT